MKLKRCFIDEHGNIWRDSTLINAIKDQPAEDFPLSNISLDEVLRWKIVNVRDYVAHYKRVRDVSCEIPIILRSDGYPMDGWHRIIKALANGQGLIARRFKNTPEPDFRNEG